MNWIQVTIYTTSDGIEPLSGVLYQLGINGIEIEDEADFKDFLENNRQYWDYVDDDLIKSKEKETCVKIYVSDNLSGREMLSEVKTALAELKMRDKAGEFGRLEMDLGNISEEDWANNWKQYFKPFKVGERLAVKPSWEEYSDDSRIILEIDPASSFGTGQHHTTRLCLEIIEKSVNKGDKVLDLGCGSGILSIAAILMGAESAVAVDIEENAAATAMENAEKNNITSEQYKTYFGNILSDEALADEIDGKYDMITANIVADVLIAMKDFFLRYIKKGGTLIISGIIEERMEEVLTAVESVGFIRKQVSVKEGWAAAEYTI